MNPSVAIIGTRGYPSYYGGFETAVRKLAPFLADAGWSVSVYSRPGAVKAGDPSRDSRVDVFETKGIEKKSLSTLSYGFSASIDAFRRKPDVALVMNVANGFFLPILKARGIKTVVNVDGIEWEREKWGFLARTIFRLGARMTAKFADEIVCDSHEISRRWEGEFGRVGTFIPYGGETVSSGKCEAGLQSKGYILVVARFVPENTIPQFFQSVPELANIMPVVIVGSSGYGGELDAKAEELGMLPNVTWVGHISDDKRLFALWANAAVYFHGHSVGGTNPTLVQAMALGVPVVARNTVFNQEVLGQAGMYCEPTPTSIFDSIADALRSTERLRQMAAEGIDKVLNIYNWDKVNGAYHDLLQRVLKAPEKDH